MTTIQLALIGLDLAAVAVLAFALYYRRHHRRDLLVAFLGVNVGVLAVTIVLAGSAVGTGLGLGLFGVLSIIRLRSSEIGQREVAYYFSALAIGLIAGLPHTALTVPTMLIGLVLLVMFAADHPKLLSRSRAQLVRLDRAIMDERELCREAEARLGLPVTALDVKEVNLVNDTTLVEVRYTRPRVSTLPVALRRAA
ncbi:MAG: DUF4956 domain-containing protein [Tessaracoccus sp.]|uniref:DUF4956 domain-containing protein n=1 Tax=Tessaracoccus sp. TaxID=1971211 RepID=UPI001ECAD761|nr:DUF4956 domain-containing protein [Tessaracoccus sp.]MBK7820454.1 DUF4956 domain-containing protein [Tessaracoccus sp.]